MEGNTFVRGCEQRSGIHLRELSQSAKQSNMTIEIGEQIARRECLFKLCKCHCMKDDVLFASIVFGLHNSQYLTAVAHPRMRRDE